ncbi:uncharacterized protein EI90DRAFT_3031297 [Cantharellus anzutake]|uniref:uncharacterized protein n=1 Tax=Cantharellus anzutake TaxID=1750568 RepID=UPI00190809B7|nr:uncharacterized protein EI90DRAFT_3031297 [Cantharellus anzutake]KAF8343073.1 hypothetical protein EI90DRAFT_3031297 [Cantharellus anzutake]
MSSVASSSRSRGPYERGACAACRTGKTKCSPRDPSTGKCHKCKRLGKKCVTGGAGQAKNSKSGTGVAASLMSTPKPSHAASRPAPRTPSTKGTGLAPSHGKGTSLHTSALPLVPILRDIVKDALHDSELDESIGWAVVFFDGAFDAKAFRNHLIEAARLGPSHPYLIRLSHWALILRQPRIYQLLGEDAEELMSTAFGILFIEIKKPTVWTFKAIIILLDHFKTIGDVRSTYLKMLAYGMVDHLSHSDSADGQGDTGTTIQKLSSILRSQFPSTDSRLSFTATQDRVELPVTDQNHCDDTDRTPMPLHPIDVCRNAQPAIRGDDHNNPPAVRPDEHLGSTSEMPRFDPSNYSLSPLSLPLFTPSNGITNAFGDFDALLS